MRILVATDAWHPQVNGVVRTLTMMADAAKAFGVEVSFLTPSSFRTFAMPSYPDLRLALPYQAKIARLIAEARRHGADGVICGHIHYATIRDEHGIRYMNCGDWVESCTALAEHEDGRFEIITWTDPLRRTVPVAPVAARAA